MIVQLFENYITIYPEERSSFPILSEQIKDHETDMTTRKNFTGHVVAGGCVIDPKYKKILMIYHKTHEKWFCPGGHIDPEDDHPVDAARREVLEETGVGVQYVYDEHGIPLLLDIDSHTIPQSEKKQEPEHWHHDMLFLFLSDSTLPLPRILDDGVTDVRWFGFSEVSMDIRTERVLSKIELN